jgi:hypothetical protein
MGGKETGQVANDNRREEIEPKDLEQGRNGFRAFAQGWGIPWLARFPFLGHVSGQTAADKQLNLALETVERKFVTFKSGNSRKRRCTKL